MVSLRCKLIVKQVLDNLGIIHGIIELGSFEIVGSLDVEEYQQLNVALAKYGFGLLDNKKAILVEKVKLVVIEMIHYAGELPLQKNSDYIRDKLQQNYAYVSNIFSEITGITLEHYIIIHKIEKAKELIIYEELNLSEISFKLGYKNASHLSTQFKKITGNTPSFFKQLKDKRRIALEDL